MAPNPKPGKDPVMDEAVHEASDVRNNFVTLFSHGVDRFAEMQKRSIDIAVQQNAELVDVWKKLMLKAPGAPRLPMFDVATTAFERFADAQKHAIDLAV